MWNVKDGFTTGEVGEMLVVLVLVVQQKTRQNIEAQAVAAASDQRIEWT